MFNRVCSSAKVVGSWAVVGAAAAVTQRGRGCQLLEVGTTFLSCSSAAAAVPIFEEEVEEVVIIAVACSMNLCQW